MVDCVEIDKPLLEVQGNMAHGYLMTCEKVKRTVQCQAYIASGTSKTVASILS